MAERWTLKQTFSFFFFETGNQAIDNRNILATASTKEWLIMSYKKAWFNGTLAGSSTRHRKHTGKLQERKINDTTLTSQTPVPVLMAELQQQTKNMEHKNRRKKYKMRHTCQKANETIENVPVRTPRGVIERNYKDTRMDCLYRWPERAFSLRSALAMAVGGKHRANVHRGSIRASQYSTQLDMCFLVQGAWSQPRRHVTRVPINIGKLWPPWTTG